jgi:outer membrane protein OmpA-like peptidoglycan-associated protein
MTEPGSWDVRRLGAISCLFVAVTVAGCGGEPRAGFDRARVGESQLGVERSMGKPQSTFWSYGKKEDSLTLYVEDDRVTGTSGNQKLGAPLPIEKGMTTRQVLSILGEPRQACNLYDFTEGQTGRICFSKGAMVEKDFIVAPPPAPVVHNSGLCTKMVFFTTGSSTLSPQSEEHLREFLERCRGMVKLTPETSFVVQGHTDGAGDLQINVALSLTRARAVRSYLVSLGISAASIEAKGYGDTKRLVPRDDAEPQNRRAEVFVRQDGKIISFF